MLLIFSWVIYIFVIVIQASGVMGRKCIVPGCSNTRKNTILHRFPQNSSVLVEWLKRIQLLVLNTMSWADVYQKKRVCTERFGETCRMPGSWNGSNLKLGSYQLNMAGFNGDHLLKNNCFLVENNFGIIIDNSNAYYLPILSFSHLMHNFF